MSPRGITAFKPILPPHLILSQPARSRPPAQVPFFLDPSHTIPTRWSLYRPLLRSTRSTEKEAESSAFPAIRRAIRAQWRKHSSSTSPTNVRAFLEKQYTLLSLLTSPSINTHTRLLELESSLSQAQTRAEARALRVKNAARPTSRLQGSYIRPTIFNPALPRLRPQPVVISMMIKKRIAAYANRLHRYKYNKELRADMREELHFWRNAGQGEGAGDGWGGAWEGAIAEMVSKDEAAFKRDRQRSEGVFGEGVRRRVEKARLRRLGEVREKAMRRKAAAEAEAAVTAQSSSPRNE